jgi:CheY-like chemotaxis protein
MILIVDDCADSRLILSLTLSRANYAVLEATNGQEGLQLLKRHDDIVLAICDWQMSFMCGAEFVQRAQTLRPQLKLILTSRIPNFVQQIKPYVSEQVHLLPRPLRCRKILVEIDALLSANSCVSADSPLRTRPTTSYMRESNREFWLYREEEDRAQAMRAARSRFAPDASAAAAAYHAPNVESNRSAHFSAR